MPCSRTFTASPVGYNRLVWFQIDTGLGIIYWFLFSFHKRAFSFQNEMPTYCKIFYTVNTKIENVMPIKQSLM